jgi:hypothetical protein
MPERTITEEKLNAVLNQLPGFISGSSHIIALAAFPRIPELLEVIMVSHFSDFKNHEFREFSHISNERYMCYVESGDLKSYEFGKIQNSTNKGE